MTSFSVFRRLFYPKRRRHSEYVHRTTAAFITDGYFLLEVLTTQHRSAGSTSTLNTSLGYGRFRILH